MRLDTGLENVVGTITKDVQMSFRVEPDLRAEFAEATERDHRPASQVLRDFMRRYVQQDKDRAAAQPANDMISVAEQQRRQDAANFARASVGLEGFKVADDYAAHAQRFVHGDIEFAELTKAVHEQARGR
jgi:hypothetical protein